MTQSTDSLSTPSHNPSVARGLAVALWRIFLLVTGGGLAFLGGILVAFEYPQDITEKPFVAKVWEWGQSQTETTTPASSSSAITNDLSPAPASESSLPADTLKVTLPSDYLFVNDDSTLKSEASAILDEFVVTDLKQHEGETVYIAAYTHQGNDPQFNRELSFQRAKAIEQYLAKSLEGDYRWIVTGYGQTRPLVAQEDEKNASLNRRVEIAVD